MKTKMILLLVAVWGAFSPLLADNDRPIKSDQLPESIRTFVQKHFPEKKMAIAKMEEEYFETMYDLIFTDGTKLEFDRKGSWTKINCKRTSVPWSVVPPKIASYVEENYPEVTLKKLERKKKHYKVHLSNGIKLSFDKECRLVDLDD